jgi:hypothetical protein
MRCIPTRVVAVKAWKAFGGALFLTHARQLGQQHAPQPVCERQVGVDQLKLDTAVVGRARQQHDLV